MQEPSVQAEKSSQSNQAAATQSSPEPAGVNYKDTLNLPQTTFKMKAGAATREVEIETYWEENRVYHTLMASRRHAKPFVLHDGPPYLSSDKIHIGTALNKILKDVVTRYKSQQGFYTPYVPGYDGHGLPIENAVVKNIKGGRHAVTEVELRQRCREFALSNLKGQETNFKRLGVWGHWEKPYITIDAEFEATQIKVFGELYQKGYVYKGLKPVYWCPHCETALADAEVEYDDHVSHSIYVKFPITLFPGTSKTLENLAAEELQKKVSLLEGASFVIWTTTPWTLPANLALAVHPGFVYVVVDTSDHGKLIVAEDLLSAFAAQSGLALEELKILGKFCGEELELTRTQHPFIDRESVVLLGEHVTLEAGTGVVHTAPGHGMDDYLVVQTYNRDALKTNPLPILSPVDNTGRFTEEAKTPSLQGIFYEKANELVLTLLKDVGALVQASRFNHSYPHCWRCHQPVIYRATEQWFIDIEQFRGEALKSIDTVEWLPERGRNRIFNMVEGRGDWCLSRQRVWGVPIPVLYCANSACRQVLLTSKTIDVLYETFKVHSSDIWWAESADTLLASLPESDRMCTHCGGHSFDKEMDIMDVWFDSGITHTAVVKARQEELGTLPVQMYLEGSDQHRGWFQSSLLTSVMLYDKAPYERVLTHGFVLDEQGRKMSKSLGNVVDPNTVIREYGADVLRLWVASVDYTNDVRIGKNTLHQMAEIYKKVRNTIRFILGNVADFDPSRDAIPYDQLSLLDRYTLHRVQHILGNITDAFEKWEFYRYCHEIQYLCMADLSQLYFDVTKDILYCDKADAPRRRAVQTVLYEILSTILPVLVPVTPHLAEDIWLSLPESQRLGMNRSASSDVPVSATLLAWPQVKAEYLKPDLASAFEKVLAVKELVNQALELPRSEGRIGSSLEATISILPVDKDVQCVLSDMSPSDLAVLCITSDASLVEPSSETATAVAEGVVTLQEENGQWQTRIASAGVTVLASPAVGQKCQRCWRYESTVGQFSSHSSLCERCYRAVE